MCRLYGFRANEPTKVECSLVLAQNSLMSQARSDLRSKTHPDGWGIAWYHDGVPILERRATAAFHDLAFGTTAERVLSRSVVAHVRLATVGGIEIQNVHPFVVGAWTLAHNGTVVGFDELADELATETDIDLLDHRRGSTDSEALFLWLLTRFRRRLRQAGGPTGGETYELAAELAEAVLELADRCRRTADPRPPRLNVVLTDGRRLFAVRYNRELHWLQRKGVHDCEICGIPHVEHREDREYRAVVVASEPLTHESWTHLPDQSLLVVEGDLSCRVMALDEIAQRSLAAG